MRYVVFRSVIRANAFGVRLILSDPELTVRALHKFDPPDLKDADVHKPQDPLVAAMASTFAATAVMGQGGEKGTPKGQYFKKGRRIPLTTSDPKI